MLHRTLPSETKKILISIVGILFLLIAFRWNSIQASFERDEGEYAYSARLLLQGKTPYSESFLQKPPAIIYTYALGQLVDPIGVASPRILSCIFVFITILLVGFIAGRLYGAHVGIASMWIVTPMLSFPYLAALAANTEQFMLTPLMGAVALFVSCEHTRRNTGKYLLAGALATLALLYKPIAGGPLTFLYVVWIISIGRVTRSYSNVFRAVFIWFVGALLMSVLMLGYLIIRGAGSLMWEYVVIFNSHYSSHFGITLENLIFRVTQFWNHWPLLFPLFGIFVLTRQKYWWLFGGLLLSSVLMVFSSPIGHYYLLLMPFVAVMCAKGLAVLVSRMSKKVPTYEGYIFLSLCIVVVVHMHVGVFGQRYQTPIELTTWIYGNGNPFIEAVDMGTRVAQHTSPNDRIFIAGSEPEILYYANRRSSSRFVITYPFVIRTPMQRKYQQEAIQELESRLPRVIVLSQREESGLWNNESFPDFKEYLLKLLETKYTLIGGEVWDEYGVAWKSPLSKDDISASSLLLFKMRNYVPKIK